MSGELSPDALEIVSAVDRNTVAVVALLRVIYWNFIASIIVGVGIAIASLWHAGESCDYGGCTANNTPQIFGAIFILIGIGVACYTTVVSITDGIKEAGH